MSTYQLAFSVFVVVPIAIGCGGAPTEAKTAPVTPNAAVTSTPSATAASKTSSESTVSIASDILKVCGISADEAFFPFDSSVVVPTSVKALKDVATCFSSGPLKGRAMQIVGHADPRGDTDYNFALGQRRADAVASYLTNVGLGQGQMSTTSRGAMDATGSDGPSWAKDRRVDILLAK
jgi:peptidoglycan-associated lipoprotein